MQICIWEQCCQMCFICAPLDEQVNLMLYSKGNNFMREIQDFSNRTRNIANPMNALSYTKEVLQSALIFTNTKHMNSFDILMMRLWSSTLKHDFAIVLLLFCHFISDWKNPNEIENILFGMWSRELKQTLKKDRKFIKE